ncbi:MAG TPA: hypothetical protein VMP08_25790 [Anaerolineae bacterium]|nr:hypothetical protein [Anaerolineae bacterium]
MTNPSLSEPCQTIHLTEWLLPILALWREAAQHKGLHWQVTLPPDEVRLEVDPEQAV